VLAATVLGSGMTFLDSTIMNIATARIGDDFDAGFGALQWVVNAYTLVLSSLILLGGSLGDRLGRRRIFVIGTTWFAAASLGCALAPGVEVLIVLRAVQGVGAALMMPGSLAIISASFDPSERARAVGLWSGLSGVASALGPVLGGWLVENLSWRWAFGINLPIAVVVVMLALRYVPESRSSVTRSREDYLGVVIIAAALGCLTYGTIQAGSSGWSGPALVLTVLGLVLLPVFALVESHVSSPLVPLRLFADRAFSGTNLMTLLTYGALGAFFFLLVLELQVAAGYGPLVAGLANLPVTVLLLLLSSRSGGLAARIGARLPLMVGPLIAAGGLALTMRIDQVHRNYLVDILPGVIVFAFGLVLIVAPLTATVMATAPSDDVGIASGINNAVARAGGLLAVAVLPPLAGLHSGSYRDPGTMVHGYRIVALCCIGLFVVSSLVIAVTVRARAE